MFYVQKALGIDGKCRRFIIDVKAEGPVKVYVEMYADDRIYKIDWAKGLAGAEVVTAEPKGDDHA